nr:hypothetical protein HK105_000147 [Polyrhizophydium stewartii]
MSASGSLAPSASKVSKHRRKADTKMPGASSPNAAASMLAAGLPVASSGSASVVSGRPSSRRKRNPYDREASSERKSASPSPSRSAASQAHAAAAAASSSSTSSPANFAKASATSLGTLQPHRTKSALSSLLSQSSAAAAAAAAAAQPRDPSAPDGQAATPAAPPVRQCSYCFATTTPMWRHGPPGYPDLCNKCGVKWMRGRILQDGAALAPTGTTAHLAANLESSAIIASSAPADLAAAAALVGNAAPAVIVIKRSASSSGAPVALNNVATPMDTSEG